MYPFLLKKALPFVLTFILGAALSALVGLFWASEKRTETFFGSRSCDYSRRSRVHRRHLVAETRPLRITFQPDAQMSSEPDSLRRGTWVRVLAAVTFGADGKVQGVGATSRLSTCGKYRGDAVSGALLEAVKRAALRIEFEPETVDGVPVTVTREVEIPVTFN